MKVILKFFKKDKVQITLMVICTIVFIFAFAIGFMYKAFPKDPVRETMIKQIEEREAEHAKWYKELKEKNGW